MHTQNNEGGEDTENNLCFHRPGAAWEAAAGPECLWICRWSSYLPCSPPRLPALLEEQSCANWQRGSPWRLQTASLLHGTTSTSLLLSPHPQGWGRQGSAQVPSRHPEGSCRVLMATGWGCEAAGATGGQSEDWSRLFGVVTWNSCLGTAPCAELSTFSSPQRKKMVLSP